ncbi:MAG: hypothetical protein IKY21_03775 [Clostridia bacterium]|nr:hypothetical protein [Clostridia bacterium]
MKFQKAIDFLLQNANPSIKLRVKKEILGSITPEEEAELQALILNEKIIRFMAEKQQENGWIGLGFHGSNKNAGQYDNQETATKYMGEKALKGTIILNRAMDAYTTTKLTDLCYETKGQYYSEFEIPAFGQNMIRCACVSRAGYDDVIDIVPQINVALESFRRVTEVDSILDVSRPSKKFRLFNNGERWPCRYHLEILAFTTSWKNESNIRMLAEAFHRLMRTDRPESMNIPVACWIGHAVGPLWYFPEGYSISTGATNQYSTDGIRRVNLEKVEWLCRCGLYPYLKELQLEVDYILEHIDENGICNVPFYENEFRGWGPYAGLQLETDWKSKIRKQCDITFRALLILYYSRLLNGE